ncbi:MULTISPECIES: DUF1194 domain-containing protein [unclassified Methylobacterium]|jgi:Protein of unknown function (DUF1194)|uniref:DUF1194 domain-containing protein n=1 Tax=unclassified Methylobacterium TaxID=2615210 RepID=UPI0013529F1F|nr:DUF1194 domain-containing protein [Methylobacterium sp. 2A]MWV21619.1 DUF1194 domain-containing protein [Methylobacterium sp. 2A]
MRRRHLLSGLLAALSLAGRRAGAADQPDVDVLLVLAVDVSLSISEARFDLERRGYAEAFADPRVLRAIGDGPAGRIGVALFDWAGPGEQRVAVDWMIIGSAQDAAVFAARLAAVPRPFYGRTAIGSALGFAADLLARAPFRTERKVIDISGDGTGNAGRSTPDARDAAVSAGITVNGIVVLTDPEGMPSFLREHTNPPGGLAAYYRDHVIGGEGAFVMSAESFEAFGRAIIAKLIREIS